MNRSIRSLGSRSGNSSRRPSRGRSFLTGRRLLLEPLEDRRLLSASLTLTIAAPSISEAGGTGATTATVTRNTDTTDPLVVYLTSSDTTEAAVPGSVTIPANQASATFNINAVDNAVVDGTQNVTITAAVPSPLTLDATFGIGGLDAAGIEQNDAFGKLDLVVQVDGKVLTLGDDADSANAWRLAPRDPDGSPDTTFGNGGAVSTLFPNSTGGQPHHGRPVGWQDRRGR